MSDVDFNFKGQLQEYVVKHSVPVTYTLDAEATGPEHNPAWTATCVLQWGTMAPERMVSMPAPTKAAAEKHACQLAFQAVRFAHRATQYQASANHAATTSTSGGAVAGNQSQSEQQQKQRQAAHEQHTMGKDTRTLELQQMAVTALKQYFDARHWEQPEYTDVRTNPLERDDLALFQVTCTLPDQAGGLSFTGEPQRTKKAAKKHAAHAALEYLLQDEQRYGINY